MPTVELSDRTLHFRERGAGEAVLLLHAFPFHSGMWAGQLDALSDRWRLVAPDARGLGRSTPTPEALTMEMIADDAVAVLDHLGIERATVLGLSMGGYAALALWQRHAARVASLVLCDTRTGADSEEGKAGRHTFAATVMAEGAAWAADQLVPVLLRKPPDPEVEATVRRLIGECDPAGIAAAQRGMAVREDSEALLAGIDVPTTVLCGADDALTAPAVNRAIADGVRDGVFVEIPGAGHLSNLEAPVAFNAALARHLEERLV